MGPNLYQALPFWQQAAIVCPLIFLGGFVDAITGGGGLITLPAYLFAGLPVHFALGTNKLSSCIGTALTTARYARAGFIPWKLACLCVAASLMGSNLGAHLALFLNDRIFKFVMLFLLPVTALYVLKGRALVRQRPPLPQARTVLTSAAIAFALGAYDGFYGPGAGTFMLLLLAAAAHLSLNTANGVAKSINMASNLAALTVFLINGRVLFPLGLLAACFGLAGNYLGARSFEHGGARAVKPIMLTVLAIFFVSLLRDLF